MAAASPELEHTQGVFGVKLEACGYVGDAGSDRTTGDDDYGQ